MPFTIANNLKIISRSFVRACSKSTVLWAFSVQFYVLTINELDDPKWANYTVPPDEFNQLSGEKRDNSQKLELERIFAQRESSVYVIFFFLLQNAILPYLNYFFYYYNENINFNGYEK